MVKTILTMPWPPNKFYFHFHGKVFHVSGKLLWSCTSSCQKLFLSKLFPQVSGGINTNIYPCNFLSFFLFQLLSEFRGENAFLRRLGPGGLGTGSLKLKNVQKSINTVDQALKKRSSLRYVNYYSQIDFGLIKLI